MNFWYNHSENEWSKITKIHRVYIVHKTLTINDKILIKSF